MTITGERVTTPAGGFGPTWHRHVAAYAYCARVLGPGRVLDLGCGTGHSYHLLAPRETVGLDTDARALADQRRQTVVADMRELPFPERSFQSVVAVHSIEHVPDADRALAVVARVLEPGGVAVLVTPNRLTFGRPDEVIDPYHYVEYDPDQLRGLTNPWFGRCEVLGLFGSARYLELVSAERRRMDLLLGLDPLRLRRALPRNVRQRIYDRALTRARRDPDPRAGAIGVEDFRVESQDIDSALDLIAVCRGR